VLNNWELYAYDGWNLVTTARRNNDASVVRRVGLYCWGPDLGSAPLGSTTWQAAGGVGGFLFSVDYSNSAVTYIGLPAPPADPTDDHYFACQDRLGNITGIMRATSGQTALESVLDYDPFGREIRATGTAARRLPFHFSSKFTDFETGLAYYGYRYYDPRNGRWLSRDPIGEGDGPNLYAMVHNNPVNMVDMDGRTGWGPNPNGAHLVHKSLTLNCLYIAFTTC
jgi:RHS repeat-associated protein